MPFQLHPSDARGKANHGWLDTRHSFSFARWYNPEHMGIGRMKLDRHEVKSGTVPLNSCIQAQLLEKIS